jgi:hypothetical protein
MTEREPAATWLPDWMARQIAKGVAQRAVVAAIDEDAMYLCGYLGVDTALTSTGAVFVGEYDLETFETAAHSIHWHQVEGPQRLGWIVLGARRFAELRALLPVRAAGAVSCGGCRGTGDWLISSADRKESLRIRGMVCKQCGGLGWQAPAA